MDGKFYVDLEEKDKVQVQLLATATGGNRTSGLIVEGIEFRTFESITITYSMEYMGTMEQFPASTTN